MTNWARRNVLRGMARGAAVTVALPFLDLFLDGNGQALAATGAPLPRRFGTWFWGCGINSSRWIPDTVGANYDLKPELSAFAPIQEKLNVFSGFNCLLGGRPNLAHWSGIMATFAGASPSRGGQTGGSTELPTIDTLIADAIGADSRFRSLEVACTGNPGVSYSMRAGSTVNPSEVDPVKLYQRIFGPEFKDPNAAEFQPDPKVMVRRSVLSSVTEQREALLKRVGAADKARVDQYFTSLRQVEQQLAMMLEKPAPAEACVVAAEPGEVQLGPTWDVAVKTHDVLTDLLVMALACNQTKVINVALSNAASNLRLPDSSVSFHELTHEEPIDEKLGYQPKSTYFMERAMEAFASLAIKMEGIKEGDGTLLDNSLLLATSESNYARLHTIDNLPVLVAGRGGGKWKSGMHIDGKGDASSRVGLTIQQALGMPIESWGAGAMQTSKPVSEILV